MNRRQIVRQLAYLLERATWPNPPQARVFEAVLVSEDDVENFLPDAKTPFVIVSALTTRGDPEHPERDREARFRVTVVSSGVDRHGAAAIVGRDRASLGQSDGAGVLELEEPVRAALSRLGPEQGIIAAAAADATSQVVNVQGVEVATTRFDLVAFNVPALATFSLPSRFRAQDGAGQVALYWDLPPDRFDRVGVVIRRSDPNGLAPLGASDGQAVSVAPLATSVVVPLPPGTYWFAVFGAYDELLGTPSVPNRFSPAVFATAVVT
jgi:hypothetical protein